MEKLYGIRQEIFWIGFILLVASVLFFGFQKNKLALGILLLAGFFFFLYSGVSIPILNVWDERFHALVAKNLMKHFLMPTLYEEELLSLPYRWDHSHIWLHKQPMFMWQAAISYKIFGVNEIAYRLPGILLCCIILFAAYRTGKLLGNEQIGYITAFLITTSLYIWKLVSGSAELDQNDVVFMSYISLSIWCFTEYVNSNKFFWIILIGLFSGFAILTKWAVGFLVYLIWFLYTFFENRWKMKSCLPLLISFVIALVVSIPWQILTFIWYPAEASIEYTMNASSFTKAIDGQRGPFTYHLNLISTLFGSLVPYLIIPALIVFYLKSKNKRLSLAMIITLLFIYLFFSFAQTKMPSFTIISLFLIYIPLSFLINYVIDWIIERAKLKPVLAGGVIILFLCFIAFFRIDFSSLKDNNGFWGHDIDCFNRLKHNKEIFQKLKLPDNTVLCNLPGRHFVEAMYYTNLPAYGFIPGEMQHQELIKKGKRIALFVTAKDTIPKYLQIDNNLIILTDTLEQCE